MTVAGANTAVTQGGAAAPYRGLPILAAMAQCGRLNLAGLISERLPLEQINDAVSHARIR
ncbi:hypothetical protein [Microtetraspora malaysiensis]|uniref:hypothetical protein n=1 Tax=Microtetraspora malaysiensis TaxID=161358 RepID=UPI003D8A437B